MTLEIKIALVLIAMATLACFGVTLRFRSGNERGWSVFALTMGVLGMSVLMLLMFSLEN